MRCWLITVGEPLPLPGSTARRWRTGLLAETLRSRGHDVLWWTSTVDHFSKRYFLEGEPRVPVAPRLELQFLHGEIYKRNVSLARLRNHAQIGRRFAALATQEPPPDVIVASLPTLELADEAVKYGHRNGVKVIVDVRDLWPDIFVEVAPPPARPVARWLLKPLFRRAASALRQCAAITAVSDSYLAWGLDRAGRTAGPTDAMFPLGYEPVVPTDADRTGTRAMLSRAGVEKHNVVAVFAGQFGRTYDLGTVIEAARMVNFRDAGDRRLCTSGTTEHPQ
jgi:hypothetical protein